MNSVGQDVGEAVMLGKVVRPLRSVDPSQTEYQGLIEHSEEGESPLALEGYVHQFNVFTPAHTLQ